MRSDDLTVGSVVGLISGGPKMTVRKVLGDGCDCVWFVWTGSDWTGPHTGWFAASDLVSSVIKTGNPS